MNTTFFIAYDDDGSDFASANFSSGVPSGGGNGWFPGLETLGELLIWNRRIEITIAIITVLFTAFVMVVIAKEKSFHNATNYFVVNLMASDFAMGVGWLIQALFDHDRYSQCGGLFLYLRYVMFQVSCCTLILLTFTRYDAILNPLRSIGRWNKRRVLTAAIISWLASFIIHIPSYFLVCFAGTIRALANHMYTYSIMFLIPSIILIFCYTRITCRVLGNAFRNKQLAVAKQQRGTPGLRSAVQKKLTCMVVTILLVFFLLRAPVLTFILYKYMTGWASAHWLRDRIVLLTGFLMFQLHGAVDPFIYAFCAPQFREYLAAKLSCCRRKQKEGSQ